MSMVEHNDDSNREVIDGLHLDYGEYEKISDFFDFPLESLEGDGKDWDASNSQDYGLIPFDDFMGLYPSNINNEYVNKAPSCNHNALISVESEQKEQVECVDISNNTTHRNGANSSRQSVISPETSASQTRSPISVLESNGACSSDRSLPTRFEMDIPVRARSKRGRPSNVNPWLLKPLIGCPAPVAKKSSNSIEGKKRSRTTELPNSPEGLEGSLQQFTKRLPEDLNHTEKKETTKQRNVGTKKCTHCHVTKTPQWREGPLGKHTLCNACGVRYRSGRLFPEYRPAASPTFTPSLHSNSHRKVIEMRGKAIQETVLVKNPMSSLSESVPVSNLFDDSMF